MAQSGRSGCDPRSVVAAMMKKGDADWGGDRLLAVKGERPVSGWGLAGGGGQEWPLKSQRYFREAPFIPLGLHHHAGGSTPITRSIRQLPRPDFHRP